MKELIIDEGKRRSRAFTLSEETIRSIKTPHIILYQARSLPIPRLGSTSDMESREGSGVLTGSREIEQSEGEGDEGEGDGSEVAEGKGDKAEDDGGAEGLSDEDADIEDGEDSESLARAPPDKRRSRNNSNVKCETGLTKDRRKYCRGPPFSLPPPPPSALPTPPAPPATSDLLVQMHLLHNRKISEYEEQRPTCGRESPPHGGGQ